MEISLFPEIAEVSLRTETFPVAFSIVDMSMFCFPLIFKSEL